MKPDVETLMILLFFSCICVVVSTLSSLSLLLLHNSRLSLCRAVPANQRRERVPAPRSKQLLFVLCGMHGTFSRCTIIHILLHNLCSFMPDTNPMMSIKRRKAHFLALVLPYATTIDGDTHRASLYPENDQYKFEHHHHIHTELSNTIRSLLHALFPHLIIDTEQLNSSRLCLVGADTRAGTPVTTLSAMPSRLHSLTSLSNSP